MTDLTRETLAELDRQDRLAAFRDRFDLPEGIVYLDGNSLGARPRAAKDRLDEVVTQQWGRDLITSWNKHGWIDAPQRVGGKIARLVGAQEDEVIVADNTSTNLFKVLAAALAQSSDRKVIVSERDNFPTDLYMAQGLIALLGRGHRLRLVDSVDEIAQAVDENTAVLMLTHVNYRSGRMHDMAGLTDLAHAKGAAVVWDLAHSAGAVPVDLNAAKADYAVGCGYKFLNGGPGAPAFLFVAKRHQEGFTQPLSGWMGHASPFAFDPGYEPAPGVKRYLCGTPPILSLCALEVGLDTMADVEMPAIRSKSLTLGDLFILLVDQTCDGLGLELATPRDPDIRGSQISYRHAEAYPVMQALIARGIIGDFRAPNILRFGITPLYLRHVDIWDAVAALREVLQNRDYDRAEFRQKLAVT